MNFTRLLSAASGALLITGALAAAAHAAPAEIEIDVRSSVTGRGLSKMASVAVKDNRGQSLASAVARASAPLRQRFQVPPGLHRLEVDVPGHNGIRVALDTPAGKRLPVKVWLDPEETPNELRPEVVKQKTIATKTMLHGHVIDDATGEPLSGATVTLELTKSKTHTDANGYFVIYGAPQLGAKAPDPDLPSSDNLVVQRAGFKIHRIVGTPLIASDNTHFIIEMETGTGSTERDDTHKLVKETQQAILRKAR